MKKRKVVFKHYDQNQPNLLPPSYEELVPKNHPVRVVNEVLERIDITELEKSYRGGGTSSYHPRMLLKVLVFAYLRNIYSSRKIEEALEESVYFMWLSGGAKPDHNTIANFRSKRLRNSLKTIFNQVVKLLAEEGHITMRDVTVDGTKIEANANRYTFVWGKSVKRYKEGMEKQLKELWRYVESVYRDEEQKPNEPDFEKIDSEKVTRTIEAIDKALAGKTVDEEIGKKLKKAKKEWPGRIARYDEQERLLNGRNSYSKTDPDATFMRTKDDHLRNAQLKANYNVQAATEDHWILNYTMAQTPADTSTLKDHIRDYLESYGKLPKTLTADAGYGSEENYQYLEEKKIEAFVKYNYFDKEQTDRKHKELQKNPFLVDNLYYNKETDTYYCPMGQKMKRIGERENITDNGYTQIYSRYEAQNCKGCPMRGPCLKNREMENRIIERNHNLHRHREKVKELLTSEEGKERRSNRYKVEAVFGNIKQNKGFRRFALRGIEKVNVEFGLIAIAQNIARLSHVTTG